MTQTDATNLLRGYLLSDIKAFHDNAREMPVTANRHLERAERIAKVLGALKW